MRRISEYLARFTTLTAPEGVVKEAVVRAVSSTVGIQLKPADLVVSRSRVSLKVDSILRSEIMLHKAAVLRAVAELLPGTRVIREIV